MAEEHIKNQRRNQPKEVHICPTDVFRASR